MPHKERACGPCAAEIYRAPMSLPYRDGLIDRGVGRNGELAERALTVIRQAIERV